MRHIFDGLKLTVYYVIIQAVIFYIASDYFIWTSFTSYVLLFFVSAIFVFFKKDYFAVPLFTFFVAICLFLIIYITMSHEYINLKEKVITSILVILRVAIVVSVASISSFFIKKLAKTAGSQK